MRVYALVRDGKTVNRIVWDGFTAYTPPHGCTIVPEKDAPPMESAPAEKVANPLEELRAQVSADIREIFKIS